MKFLMRNDHNEDAWDFDLEKVIPLAIAGSA
jgi:hypothetical protein